MPTTEIRSSDTEFALSANGITYTAVEQIESDDADDAASEATVNNYDETSEQVRHGLDTFSGSVSYVRGNPPPTGQELIETARAGQKTGTYYYARHREETGSGFREREGQIMITSHRETGRSGDYRRWTLTYKFITEPTISGQ